MYIYIYKIESLFCIPETNTTLKITYISIPKREMLLELLLFSHGTENLNPISQMRNLRLGEAQLLAAACAM